MKIDLDDNMYVKTCIYKIIERFLKYLLIIYTLFLKYLNLHLNTFFDWVLKYVFLIFSK